ncbi:hydroxyacid dehydrogenase [Butyricicoccus pullicaecorum]|uniref:hydroxyacid dehydrogenase n=1 Tax=Butyricicoccus pullicaecorum TaxID=501571 RepID=UPI0039904BEE
MKIFLTEKIHADAVAMMGEHVTVVQGTSVDPDEIVRQAQDCDAILVRSARITAEMMDKLPKLRAVAKHGIGVDNIDVKGATERGILVVNVPFANVNAVAEHGLALLMAASKFIPQLDRMTREGGFARRNEFVTTELAGKTIGLVGLGRISSLLAKKLSGFSVRILASDPFVTEERAKELGVELVDLDTVLAESDFVSLHTPLLDSTRHMMGREQFAKMKKTAWLINVSRGPVVDEEALIEALKAKEIAGAALDVFEQEPPAADNALFALDNVVLSPHNAALSDNALRAMAMDSAQGLVDYLEGRRPEFPVNREVLEK